MKISQDSVVLDRNYWLDRNGLPKFGPNALVIYEGKPNIVCIWGIDKVVIEYDKIRGPVEGNCASYLGYLIPESLFSIELVDFTETEVHAVISFNVDEYKIQNNRTKQILTEAIKNGAPLNMYILRDDFILDNLEIKFGSFDKEQRRPVLAEHKKPDAEVFCEVLKQEYT